MRSGIAGALIVGLCALLLVGALWFAARDAPSAGTDPYMTPLSLVPTRTPTPAAEMAH
jgi:hypothetical protein